jgi:redox-regulated HSP33 family molecular chaperone
MLKGDQKLTVTVDGQGPIGRIIADANAKGEVRAYVDSLFFPLQQMLSAMYNVSFVLLEQFQLSKQHKP